MPFSGFDDFDDCLAEMVDDGHDEQSAQNICGALQSEAKSEHGDPSALLDAIKRGSGLVADVGVDLVSGVDVPAVNSKWVMLKSDDDGHDYQVTTPILLDKADGDEAKRIGYAAAMIPREPDKEGDVVPTATVERAAHGFLKDDGGIDTDHSLIDGEGEPVESWVLKEERTFSLPDGGEETYPAGTWMLGVEWGQEAWKRIKEGELTGLSIYGMAEHVPLARSAGPDGGGCLETAEWARQRRESKALDIPLATESVVHLVYESQTAAEKASEEMGLGGAVHEHEFDGMTVFMPGETHEDFVDAYMELSEEAEASLSKDDADPCWEGYTMVGTQTDENGNEVPNCVPDDEVPDATGFSESHTPTETKELTANKSESGDSGKSKDSVNSGMGEDNPGSGDGGDGDGPTLSDVAASVESLKDAVSTEKQDAGEAAAVLAEEYDLGSGDVMDVLSAAQGMDAADAVEALQATEKEDGEDDEDEDGEEMEAEKDTEAEKSADEPAHMAKGHDGEGTRTAAVEKRQGDASGGKGVPSYAAAAEAREEGN